MPKTNGSNKLGGTLLFGGIAIAAVTLSGVYISQNPDLISSIMTKNEVARHDEMMKRVLVAPQACANLDTSVFTSSCPKLEMVFEEEGVFENLDWKEGLTAEHQSCLLESYNQVTQYQLEYRGDSLSKLENMQADIDIIHHACAVSEDLKPHRPGHSSADAQSMLNTWYQWKHEEGNDFH